MDVNDVFNPHEKEWDFIVCGAGLAGLSFVARLLQAGPQPWEILLIDPEKRVVNDRTWCFVEEDDAFFSHLVTKRWSRVAVSLGAEEVESDLGARPYCLIEGGRFFAHCWQIIEGDERVTLLRDQVVSVWPDEPRVSVEVASGAIYKGGQALQSHLDLEAVRKVDPYWVEQHFMGWMVESDEDCFDPARARLMDFQAVEPGHGVEFVYLLPLSPRRALVEYTVFSGAPWELARYEAGLRQYLADRFAGRTFRVVHTERGRIPMSLWPGVQPQPQDRVVFLGGRSGRVKASTGYAFLRIQRECADAVRLAVAGRAVRGHRCSWFWNGVDGALLVLMGRNFAADRYFLGLFKRWGAGRVLAFLDERTAWWQTLWIMACSPWHVFVPAAWVGIVRACRLRRSR